VFGLYRFILALLVALSHHGMIVARFNPGQWAVVCFYMLSGLLMERQFHKLAPRGGVGAFYLDRVFRIFPLYLTVLAFAVLIIPASWTTLLMNALLLPTNYTIFTGGTLIIATAWSLACEAQFYLLVPFFSVLPTFAIRILLVASLLFFCGTAFLPGSGILGYGFLPGILFTFLSGILINRGDWLVLRMIYGCMVVLCAGFMLSKIFPTHLKSGIHINICLGYLIGVPVMTHLSRLSPKIFWDQLCGLFSYPLFLVHPVVVILCAKYLLTASIWVYLGLSLVAAGCLVLLIEKPFDSIRYAIREGRAAALVRKWTCATEPRS